MRTAACVLLLTAGALSGCAAAPNGNRDGSNAADSANDDMAPVDDTSVDDVYQPPADTGHGCVPTVATGGEASDALCSDGVDNDCNGYIDCNDFHCSRNAAVTVCSTAHDAGTDTGPITPGTVGAMGGTVDLLHFSVFGDVRPPNNNDTTGYPTAIIDAIMTGMQSLGTQFTVASGDYMFATSSSAVTGQLAMLLTAERGYHNHIFHGMGNHECTGAVTSNCPLGNETPNISNYLSQLNPSYGGHPYYDFVVHTRLGAAHFIVTAPNAWSTTQQSWLRTALAQTAFYTFVIAHEPPDALGPPAGTPAIESLIAARTGGVTLRLYGHTHEYRHYPAPDYNAVVDGNAGAPLGGGSTSGQYYGFGIVDQRADGNIVFTAYQTGTPPMPMDSWVVAPDGTRSR